MATAGERRRHERDDWPRFHAFQTCEWVEAGTYRRLRFEDRRVVGLVHGVGAVIECVVWQPPAGQVRRKCDNCVRYHRPTNVGCSATLGRRTSFLDGATGLYGFGTQTRVVGRWRLVNAVRRGRSPMEKETYMRVA